MDAASQQSEESLGQEVRAQYPAFKTALCAAVEATVAAEYPRMRGYCYENGTDHMRLAFTVECGFGPKGVTVMLSSRPVFEPRPIIHRAEVAHAR